MQLPEDGARADDARKVVPFAQKTRSLDLAGVALAPARDAGALLAQVEQVRASTGAPPAKSLRRLLFFWLRVYVRSSKRGKAERVNVAIPIPIPLVGILFPGRLNWSQALQVATLAGDPAQGAEVGQYLESCMALELVRVEQDHPERQHHELVVVGLD